MKKQFRLVTLCIVGVVLAAGLALFGCSSPDSGHTDSQGGSPECSDVDFGGGTSGEHSHGGSDDCHHDDCHHGDCEDDTYYLKVMETTDIHGNIVDISSGDESTYQYRLARIADAIEDARDEGDVLLLDTGDCYQANPVSGQLDGEPIRAYLDACDYDAVGLGNHEFDWGLSTSLDDDGTVGSWNITDEIAGDSDIPVVCWDVYETATGEKTAYTQDYVIVDKVAKNSHGEERTYKVAIFGYVDDYSSSIAASCFSGYEIHEDDITAVEAEARSLEESGAADLSVMVCHVGPDDMDALVEEDSAFDLVCCGHTHQVATGTLSNGVPYLLGGSAGAYYASANLVIEDGAVTVEDEEVTRITDDPEALYDNEENQENLDADVLAISHASIEKVNEKNPVLLEVLGFVTKDVSRDALEGTVGQDVASTWAAGMLAQACGAQVGIINSTGIRSEISISTGADRHYVTGADIYAMLPFGDEIYEYELTYQQLYNVCCKNKLTSYSYLAISGVTAYYSSDTEIAKMYLGDELIYDGGWIEDENSTVTVAVNSFIASYKKYIFAYRDPINDPSAFVDNVSVISYLEKNYGPDEEIPVDSALHLITIE